ncbi:hypothetical protein PG996_013217 [Apiospora saccharicola]|uniref:Ecp2 effector protein-like domain-containing protein n=1 Tax=Apiospora saccharicola TaxID=335842 RepID=A0ABR1U6X7_9PEZI
MLRATKTTSPSPKNDSTTTTGLPRSEPRAPESQHQTLHTLQSKSPAIVDLDPAKDAGGTELPYRDDCEFVYMTLETEAGSSPPKQQQPWILAEVDTCVFVLTAWHPPKDDAGKKLTIEVGNDDVKHLVRESLNHHVKGIGNGVPRVGTKGSMDCGGVSVEWQIRKMQCGVTYSSKSPSWCTEE